MHFTRAQKITVVAVVVALGLIIYGGYVWQADKDKYAGLVTQDDTGLTEESRAYFDSQLATAQAALAAQAAGGADVDLDLYMTAAWNAAALGDLVLAREIYADFFQLNAINPAAWNHYGSILLRMEDYPAAEAAFRTAIGLAPSEENYHDLVTAIGNTAPDGSRADEIKDILEAGVAEVGQTPWFMTELAGWYLEHGDCDRALDHYQVAKGLLPAGNESIEQDIEMAETACE